MWTEGICGDGAAILRDGVMVPVEEVISTLNQMMMHGEENHIIDCNYCGKQQVIVHPTSTPKHKVFCPICRTQMVPTRWQSDDGAFLFGWSCGCDEQSRWLQPVTACDKSRIEKSKELESDLVFAYKRAKVLADMLGIPVQESPEVTGTILGLVRRSVELLIAERDLFKKEAVALATEATLGIVYLVCTQWEHEGNEDLAAFRDRASAEEFVSVCEEYQKTEPDDNEDGTEWENSHPGKPYLSAGDTLCGVESFVIVEIPVL